MKIKCVLSVMCLIQCRHIVRARSLSIIWINIIMTEFSFFERMTEVERGKRMMKPSRFQERTVGMAQRLVTKLGPGN